MQLVTQRTFSYNELSGIGSVQAIDAIGSCSAVLHTRLTRLTIAIAEKASGRHHILRNGL